MVFLVATGMIGWFGWTRMQQIQKLEDHGIVHKATVESVARGKSGGSFYVFEVGGARFRGKSPNVNYNSGDSLQIVYLPEDPAVSFAQGEFDTSMGSSIIWIAVGLFVVGITVVTGKYVSTNRSVNRVG